MTEGTRTPAQRAYDEYKRSVLVRESTRITWDRAEEVASDVRALAATVEHLRQIIETFTGSTIEITDDIDQRLAVLESPGSAEAALSVSCSKCEGSGIDSTTEVQWSCDACGGNGRVPAEQAVQEPPAPTCTAKEILDDRLEDGDGYLRSEIAGVLRDALNTDDETLTLDAAWRLSTKVIKTVKSYAFTESPAAVQEPPALDPCIDDIITQAYLYGSARCAQGVEVGAGRDSGEAIKRMLKEWEALTEMIFAYGGDAREGGK